MHKFVLFEGMDRTGKTKLAHKFANEFRGLYLHSPPKPHEPFREDFDKSKNDQLNYEFYHVGNHILNAQVALARPFKPIFLDRHFPSTVAAHQPFLQVDLDSLMGEMEPFPDRIYYLTADPQEVLSRCVTTGTKNDRFHTPEIIPKIYANYERIFKGSYAVLRIDTTFMTEEEVEMVVRQDLVKNVL